MLRLFYLTSQYYGIGALNNLLFFSANKEYMVPKGRYFLDSLAVYLLPRPVLAIY